MKKIILAMLISVIFTGISTHSKAQGVGIGTKNPDPSAKLHIESVTQGTLITRMSSSQRDSIVNPADGLMIYNTDSKCINLFRGSLWYEVCGNCIPPAAPQASSNSTVCINDTVKLFCAAVKNASYTWSGPNGFSSALQNPVIPNCSNVDAGTYSVTLTVSGCVSAPSQTTVTVANPPSMPSAVTGPSCLTQSQLSNNSYSVINVSGVSYNWTVSPATGVILTPSSNTCIVTFPSGNNSYTLTVTPVTGSCTGTPRTFTVSVQSTVCTTVNYNTGNEAYWTEAVNGFRPVSIGGGSNVYTYNSTNKQYESGNYILIPDLTSSPDGMTVDATNFYGFNGGTADNNKFQWDGQSNSSVTQPSIFDQVNMFISPVSADMSFCTAMQYVSSNCSSTVIDGPNTTLAYPLNAPLSGTYNLTTGSEQINAGSIKGGSNNYISQQQLEPAGVQSYCVTAYGNGWRMPTDIEMGHNSNTYGWNMGNDISYNATSGGGDYHLWSTQRELPNSAGGRFIYWPLGTNQNGYWDGNNVSATNQKVRCVYQGR